MEKEEGIKKRIEIGKMTGRGMQEEEEEEGGKKPEEMSGNLRKEKEWKGVNIRGGREGHDLRERNVMEREGVV